MDDQEDDFGLTSGGRKGARRRGGELYDAFAAESDEELFSGDEEKYKDEDDERRDDLQEGEKSGR